MTLATPILGGSRLSLPRALVVLAMVASTVVALAAPASAADPVCHWDKDKDGNDVYVCTEPGQPGEPGEPGGPGGGGGLEPPCEFKALYNDFCRGKDPCFRNDPAAIQDPAENGLDPGSKPDPDSHAVYWECQRADGSTYELYYWSGDEPRPPTLGERALQALGQIDLPTFTLATSPPTFTLVNLDTWWWADGAGSQVLGSSALGVRAVATPDRMEVDPGDGSGVMTCPFVTEESDACSYTYGRTSVSPNSSDDAYDARMRLVYSIHFEIGGATITVPGAPDELPTNWAGNAVEVLEQQTIVVPRR